MNSHTDPQADLNALVQSSAQAAMRKRFPQVQLNAKDEQKTPLDVLPLPDSVVDFLAKMSLQYGIPIEYLVADERLLPKESMRYFYVDQNWVERAIDGAMSVGISGTREQLFNEQFFQEVYDAVQKDIPAQRSTLRGAEANASGLATTWSGVLLRSAVVSGYPGLEIRPYVSGTTSTNPMSGVGPIDILRMDRLAEDIMLCVFNGVPGYIEFVQPSEGIHFGISPSLSDPTFTAYLRWLGKTDNPEDKAGKQITKPDGGVLTATGVLRTGGQPGVIDVTKTVAAIKDKLEKVKPSALGPGGAFTSAEFAVEMVQSAGVQPYWAHPEVAECKPPDS